MGTDIHVLMEWFDGQKWRPFNAAPDRQGSWDSYGKWTDAPTPMEEMVKGLGGDVPEKIYFWNFPRDYDAFGQLAGVRRGEMEIWEPRGMPRDVGEEIWKCFYLRLGEERNWDLRQIDRKYTLAFNLPIKERWGVEWVWDTDYHTCSWLMISEIEAEASEHLSPSLNQLLDEVRQLARERGIPRDKIRMVFAFDN